MQARDNLIEHLLLQAHLNETIGTLETILLQAHLIEMILETVLLVDE